MSNRFLKRDISQAIAWGMPCNESSGYTPYEFTQLLVKALLRINYLEQTLKDNKIPFTETDYAGRSKIHDL